MDRRGFLRALAALGAASAVRACAIGARNVVEIDAPRTLTPVHVAGTPNVLYELKLTNRGTKDVSVEQLTVVDVGSRRLLRKFSAGDLGERTVNIDGMTPGGSALGPGELAIVYLELALPSVELPAAIRHVVEERLSGSTDQFIATSGCSVIEGQSPTLGQPLRGGPWVAVYHPAWPRGHRRVIRTLDGNVTIPGRFAIDWVRVDEHGAIANGDVDVPRNHLGYGADVLAVADARVVAARDGMTESARISENPKHTLGGASGNFITLELAPARYAFYEHLRPGSIRVAAGGHVRKGEIIAALGFTGDSTGPHLHFHLADGNSPVYSDGTPFVIDEFRVLGQYADINALGRQRWAASDAALGSRRQGERPPPNSVVQFSD